MDRLLLPLGQADFRTIRENGSYYVDKTGHIGQIIRDSASSILFTRPRRFGKTTFQSTLRAFFDIREDNKDIFTGLAIMDDEEAVEGWMNKWPVIHLTFKDIDGPSFSSAMGWMNTQIRDLYKSYRFIDDGKLGGDEAMFRRILDKNASTDDICQSLRLLVELLYDHYGKKVIILLDEYDVPLAKAEGNGYYSEMLSVMRSMKESLFTGLNNLVVYSVTGSEYASAFGFTEEEVMKLLCDASLEDKAAVVRQWYDGYSIGGIGIYTPWDVISFVNSLQTDRDARPQNYWGNSSSNDVIKRLIDMTDAEVGDDYSTLINGGVIRRKINETLTYSNLYSSPENIWSLFLMTGYLTLADRYDANEENALRLPNEEIRRLFTSSVDEWFSEKVAKSGRKELFDALWSADATALTEIISQYLFETISYYDYREDYYHAFLAGLLSGAGYIVRSNRETGTGRADIMLFDKKNRRAAIFEIKRSLSRQAMDKDAAMAIQQMDSRKYGKDLEGFRTVLFYGAAFFEKDVTVKAK